MIDNKYSNLMEKIRVTGNYITTLTKLENSMKAELEDNNLDVKVKNILSKCIDDINAIYMNTNPKMVDDKIKELESQNERLNIAMRNLLKENKELDRLYLIKIDDNKELEEKVKGLEYDYQSKLDKIRALEDKLEIQENGNL